MDYIINEDSMNNSVSFDNPHYGYEGKNQQNEFIEPIHPGKIFKQQYIEKLHIPVVHAAEILGITRQTLFNLLAGKNGISPEMALRIAKTTGTSPYAWLELQNAYDLHTAKKKNITVNGSFL